MDNVKMLRMMTSGNSDLLQEIRKFMKISRCAWIGTSRLHTYIHLCWDHAGYSLYKWGALVSAK